MLDNTRILKNVVRIYSIITNQLDSSMEVLRKMKGSKIAYLGPKGTYSEKAARLASKNGEEILPKQTIQAVVRSLMDGEAGICVMPYYNSIVGYVQTHLDLIYTNRIQIIGIKRVPIEFCAGGYPGNRDYGEIYSHPKGLQQCTKYIEENYPESRLVEVNSTSEGAEKVRRQKSGIAICSIDALREGKELEVIARDIGDIPGARNYTDFYVVAKEDIGYQDPTLDYLSMIAVTPHLDRIGLLSDVLMQIRYYGLNMTDIHSRPALDDVRLDNNSSPKMFYIEIEGHKDSEKLVRAIDAIKWVLTPAGKNIEVVMVLGSYEFL